MRLTPGLHWHKAAEWAIMLAGNARVKAIDEEEKTFIDDVIGLFVYKAFGVKSNAIEGTMKS